MESFWGIPSFRGFQPCDRTSLIAQKLEGWQISTSVWLQLHWLWTFFSPWSIWAFHIKNNLMPHLTPVQCRDKKLKDQKVVSVLPCFYYLTVYKRALRDTCSWGFQPCNSTSLIALESVGRYQCQWLQWLLEIFILAPYGHPTLKVTSCHIPPCLKVSN